MYSGGIGSWATAKRVIDQNGPDKVALLFADVKGNADIPHVGEDPDCYRFIKESADKFGARLVWLNEGRNIWDVFKDDKWIGNSLRAACSRDLKQKPCREWLDANTTPGTCTVYVGIDWSETHRKNKIAAAYHPYIAEFPMTEPPYLDKQDMLTACREWGVEPPRMYRSGYPHANCQGACVKAGQGQWKRVLLLNPELYAYHEARELEMRELLGKDVSILRDRSAKGVDDADIGGCGCFTDTDEQRAQEKGSRPITLRAFRERVEAAAEPALFEPEAS